MSEVIQKDFINKCDALTCFRGKETISSPPYVRQFQTKCLHSPNIRFMQPRLWTLTVAQLVKKFLTLGTLNCKQMSN